MVKAYDYTNARGELIFQVCRMEPKSFRQRRPDGKGGFIWDLKGIEQTPLYRLPEVIAAEEVLIVEGEKDCDNLAALGICATTCAGGAKKWRDNHNDYLKGKNIVLLPDNDNPGREHMALIGSSLNGNIASLKLLELPDLRSKEDVSDFIEKFNGDKDAAAERLAILIENARDPMNPPKKSSQEDVICDLSAFKSIEVPQRHVLLNPWCKEESIGLIYGPRGVGKSWFVIGILDAISRGENFGPWECQTAAPVMYIDGEMTMSDMQERIDDLELLSIERKQPFYIYSDHYANKLGLPRASLVSEIWRQKIKSILIAKKIKLCVFDNIASLAPGLDENKKQDWDPVNQFLLDLRFNGISSDLLHHESKEGKQRGTSAREDNLDYSIQLKYPANYTPEDGCQFVVRFTKARVNTSDLSLIANTEFKLNQAEDGKTKWTYKNVRAEMKLEVIKLLVEDYEQNTIAETLGITKGRVSQIKKQAIKDNIITPKNKLTQSGELYIYKHEKS